METLPRAGRDPVCISIESLLRDMAADGHEPLVSTPNGSSVTLRFGPLQVNAPNHDIALIRLAKAMMDEPKYRDRVMQMLRAPMRAAARSAN